MEMVCTLTIEHVPTLLKALGSIPNSPPQTIGN
jgi:hypothetical protein